MEKDPFKEQKVDIQNEKVDIASVLSDKGTDFSSKTISHIQSLFEKFGYTEIFGRCYRTCFRAWKRKI